MRLFVLSNGGKGASALALRPQSGLAVRPRAAPSCAALAMARFARTGLPVKLATFDTKNGLSVALRLDFSIHAVIN